MADIFPDDLTAQRRRQDEADDALDRRPKDRHRGSAAAAFQVFNAGTIPTVVPRYFATHPIGVIGNQVEGASPAVSVGAGKVIVLVLGPHVPVAGDNLTARLIGGRWVAQTGAAMGGYPPINYPGCLCTPVPEVLSMANHTPGCNGGNYFNSGTIRYQAIPTALAPLAMDVPAGSGKAWLTDDMFIDTNGDHYRWHLRCSGNAFFISRVYEISIFFSPFEDSTRYVWFIGAPGNTCTPFALTNGSIYSGGDPTCNVSIVEAP